MPDDENRLIKARKSKSGTVRFGDPVILKDNSRTRVSFVPFFISHSDHQELAGKIVTWDKQKSTPKQVAEKSVSLSGSEVEKLLRALKSHTALADGPGEDGDYIVVKVGTREGNADIGAHDPQSVADALARVLGQPDIISHLRNTELTTELSDALRSAIKIRELQTAVQKLRQMLNEGVTLEAEYQKWCDAHYWALGPALRLEDASRRISISDQVDVIIKDIASGLSDVVELKRPSMPVLRYDSDHRNYYFSTEVSQAIGQCHRYLDVLHDAAAQGLRDHPEIVAYHPRATIVIGRSIDWDVSETRALHGLNQRLRSIKVMTYDHLLAQSEAMLAVVDHDSPTPNPAKPANDFDDEIPF